MKGVGVYLKLKLKLKEQFVKSVLRKSCHLLAVGIRDYDIQIFVNGHALLNAC